MAQTERLAFSRTQETELNEHQMIRPGDPKVITIIDMPSGRLVDNRYIISWVEKKGKYGILQILNLRCLMVPLVDSGSSAKKDSMMISIR